MNLCKYGCGREAKFQNQDGSWKCSSSHIACPKLRRKLKKIHALWRLPIRTTCPHCYQILKIKENSKAFMYHISICYMNPENIKLCPVCDKPIKGWRTGIVCSHSCANRYFRTGKDHPSFKPDKPVDYRKICFEHHEHKCIICGETIAVDAHHFDGDHDNISPDNFIPICPTHHRYLMKNNARHLIEDSIINYRNNWIKENTNSSVV